MGEVVLSHLLAEKALGFDVVSAGVSDEEHGKGIYPPAQRVLREAGYKIPVRRAHRASDEELCSSGLILAMTSGHAKVLRRRCEAIGVPVERIHLWREFDDSAVNFAADGCFGAGGALADTHAGSRDSYSEYYEFSRSLDVPDPWYGGHEDFMSTLAIVESGAKGIVRMLATTKG